MKVTKAIITASGRGTRFLPVSNAYQKEMVPVMHKPQLQWVIEEAIESGITDIAIIVREGRDDIKRYLAIDNNLFKYLKKLGKAHLMDSVIYITENAQITIIEQKESDPYGNGTPYIVAKDFAVLDSVFAEIEMRHTKKESSFDSFLECLEKEDKEIQWELCERNL